MAPALGSGVSHDLHAVPVRDIPSTRISIGSTRFRVRGLTCLSIAKSSGWRS